MRGIKTIGAWVLTLCLSLSFMLPVAAAAGTTPAAAKQTADYLCQTIPNPHFGEMEGEWLILGLVRGGYSIPAGYLEGYYDRVEAYVKECQGILSDRKNTEYARLSLALTAMGKDPRDVAGYDLLAPLGDKTGTLRQGINGPIWALIALDAGAYPMPTAPEGGLQATREGYVEEILSRQGTDRGWRFGTAGRADPDLTAMALMALSGYQDQQAVKEAVERGVDCLAEIQDPQGGYTSFGSPNAESTAQVVMALCSLGISVKDARFAKNGHTLLDVLLSYQQEDGSFQHTQEGLGSQQMATEQGFLALTALLRQEQGKTGLFVMSDVVSPGQDGPIQRVVVLPRGQMPTSFRVLFPSAA